MRRYNYDKSHFSIMSGDMGRLQTLTMLPVVAGESLAINYGGVFRLSSLKRNLVLDAQVDLFAFYMPHRHAYGTDWTDFINQGVDETVTLGSGPSQNSNTCYLGFRSIGSGNFPLWVTTHYNRVWNEYFRTPTDAAGILADTFLDGTIKGERFGQLCARLPAPWSTGIEGEPVAADRQVASINELDLVALAQIKARYKTEIQRSFFATRYREVLSELWGGKANPDSDERPTLIMHRKQTLSGFDVDGTDDASLGTFSGRSAGVMRLSVPMRYFPEHGSVSIMCLIRFPTIFLQEAPFLCNTPNPTYEQLAGDADIVAAQGPEKMEPNKFFATTATTDLGSAPFGQWYRNHPNFIHVNYGGIFGFPFSSPIPTTVTLARYIKNDEYVDVFETSQLGQWQAHGHAAVSSKSPVPSAASSIFAGTS